MAPCFTGVLITSCKQATKVHVQGRAPRARRRRIRSTLPACHIRLTRLALLEDRVAQTGTFPPWTTHKTTALVRRAPTLPCLERQTPCFCKLIDGRDVIAATKALPTAPGGCGLLQHPVTIMRATLV